MITEVDPEQPRLRCPANLEHRVFEVTATPGTPYDPRGQVDEMLRPLQSPSNVYHCAVCGTPAKVREQLNEA